MAKGKTRIGITAGASAPEILVRRVVDRIGQMVGTEIRNLSAADEGVVFPLPKELNF